MNTQHEKVGMRVLGEVASLETLKPRIKRFETVAEGLAETRVMQQEITKVGKYVHAHGFSPGRDFQRVATIPSSVWSAVVSVFPTAGSDKKLFYALLAGPLRDYDTRRKPSLT